MEKDIQNADATAYKLRLASIRAGNHRLEIAKEKRQKKKEIMKKRRIKAMATKCY